MAQKLQAKVEVLNFINSCKEVLFGKFSDRLTSVEKLQKWDEVAAKAKEVQVIQEHQDGKYVRDVTWQNYRKRAMAKRDKRNKTGEAGGKAGAIDEADELVFQIIGHDSPVLDGINVPESSGSNSASVEPLQVEAAAQNGEASGAENGEGNENQPMKRKRPGPKEGSAKSLNKLHELKAQRIEEQLELCEREKHMRDLGIYEVERRLGLPPSKYTKHLYPQNNVIIVDADGNRIN